MAEPDFLFLNQSVDELNEARSAVQLLIMNHTVPGRETETGVVERKLILKALKDSNDIRIKFEDSLRVFKVLPVADGEPADLKKKALDDGMAGIKLISNMQRYLNLHLQQSDSDKDSIKAKESKNIADRSKYEQTQSLENSRKRSRLDSDGGLENSKKPSDMDGYNSDVSNCSSDISSYHSDMDSDSDMEDYNSGDGSINENLSENVKNVKDTSSSYMGSAVRTGGFATLRNQNRRINSRIHGGDNKMDLSEFKSELFKGIKAERVEEANSSSIIYPCRYIPCEFVANTERDLTNHEDRFHVIRFNCDKCEFSTPSEATLKRHCETRHEGARYSCDLCEYVTTTDDGLKTHFEMEHQGSGFFCDKCVYVSITTKNLKLHIAAKHDRVRYPCDKCDFVTSTANYLKKHIEIEHEELSYPLNDCSQPVTNRAVEIDPVNGKFLCDKCEQSYVCLSSLRKHKKNKHEGLRVNYPCNKCDFIATSATQLKYHTQSKHEGVRYPCTQCNYVGVTATNLRKHVECKHDGVRYLCKHCTYSATTAVNLKAHIENKHDGVRHPCRFCEYVASTAGNLTTHVKSLHRGVTYSCNFCDFKSNWKACLKNHMKSIHAGEESFKVEEL